MRPEPPEPVLRRIVPFRVSGTDEVLPGSWLEPPGRAYRYRILERVAAGAEGVVFKAEMFAGPGSSGIKVAIKQYRRPEQAAPQWPHDGTWAGIARQAAFLSGLPKNDHLVWIREVFLGSPDGLRPAAGGDVPFVVMDWIDGAPPEAVRSGRTSVLMQRVRYIEQLADAIGVLHSDGQRNPLSHSDIKPDNCLITSDRGLVLLDLGGLHLIAAGTSGRAPYTPPYAAPEVLADPSRAREPAADMYSLGATAFWFITGVEPPDAAVPPDRPAAAEAVLRSCRALRRPVSRRPRRRIIRHLLAAIAVVPEARGDLDPGTWAKKLRRLARGPLIRRRAALAAAVVVVMSAWAWSAGRLPFAGPEAIDPKERVIHWNLLPSDETRARRAVYDADFTRAAPGWVVGDHNGVTPRRTGLGIGLTAARRPAPAVFSVPQPTAAGAELVEATGTIVSGEGAWGLWCRGTSVTGAERYRFLLTHANAVGIFSYAADGRGAPREDGTGWWYLTGVDLRRPVTITARCLDTPGDRQIGLGMSINGRTVLTYAPPATAVLSPGFSGFETYAFTDVDGPALNAVLRSFRTATPAA